LGNTCLHYAVVSKDIERVKLLLKSSKYKPNVSVQNRSGATPLHLTSDPEIASLLLDSNADPNLVDLRGNSPVSLTAVRLQILVFETYIIRRFLRNL
jgi:ankyrin repeat protein